VRVATIDVGTNTVLLLVADVGTDGELLPAIEREAITRLGQGVDRSRELDVGAVERTLVCLEQFAREVSAARCDRVAIVGTSALRDAGGGDDFRRRASAIMGAQVRVLSGDEEAEATFLGATSDERSPGSRIVFDIGGGSTEIVVGDGATESISFATSLDIGSVRLTERLLHHDPPPRAELDALAAAITDALGSLPPIVGTLPPIGVAGTMTTLASVALALPTYDAGRVHGRVISTETLESALRSMETMALEQRRQLPAMVAARADVIVAGGAIAIAVLKALSAPNVIVSDRGVRWGVARWLARQSTAATI
jgi:exopolyphosphatase / guanosine-5'-triphosphate,3'-diphosphate pyrophosphatase